MFKKLPLLLALMALALAVAPVHAAVEVGQPAPDFEAADVHSQPFRLSDHKGKIVILEWTNNQCPYVIKHYDTGNMQKTQQAARDQGAEWVSIVSSAPGRQGHVSAEEAIKIAADAGAVISTEILDESGDIGRMYGARTTPHIFIINAEGTLVYAGAIDDNSSPRHETVEDAKNYVLAALEDLAAGRAVQTPVSEPYGCSVKYGH